MAMCQSDVLSEVVTEQQYDFFHKYHQLKVTSAEGNLVNTAKEAKDTASLGL